MSRCYHTTTITVSQVRRAFLQMRSLALLAMTMRSCDMILKGEMGNEATEEKAFCFVKLCPLNLAWP